MFEQAYGSVLVIVAGSIILGRAICTAGGGALRWSAAPLVGLSALMVLAFVGIKLPGRADTAIVLCALAIVAAAGWLVVQARRTGSLRQVLALSPADGVIAAIALFAASIPFIGQDRIAPGAFVDGDMAIHLILAEALRSPHYAAIYHSVTAGGYPAGPHALVATVGTAIDAPLIQVFAGLLVAVMVLTAIAAGDVLGGERVWRRAVVGVLCAAAYLVAAYYGEGSFKETIMAGLVLAFALHLQQIRDRWTAAPHARRFAMAVVGGVLVAGAIYTYSYLGLAWFAATLVVWLLLEIVMRASVAGELLSRANMATAAPWVAAFAVLALIALIPDASSLGAFFGGTGGLSPTAAIPKSALGNLTGPLSIYEALGIWVSGDFRQVPSSAFDAGELGAFALAVLVFAAAWSLRRRDLPLLAAGLGAMLLWLYSQPTQSPYVTAKAMVIGSPLVIALVLRALLTSRQGGRWVAALLLVVAAIFGYGAAYSSYTTLRNAPIQSSETVNELADFHRITGNAKTLFLGLDNWSLWELHNSPVADLTPGTEFVSGVELPPNKPNNGQPLDFDSVTSASLDNFAYVVTTNTDFAGQAPANFRLLARRPLYELWKRTGPTPPFSTFSAPGQPGAIFECQNPILGQLAKTPGIAAVMTQPVIVGGIPGLATGHSGVIRIGLPAGTRWEISAQYTAWTTITISAQGRSVAMPAYMGQNGPFFNALPVTGQGVSHQIVIRITAGRPSILSGSLPYDDVYNIAAVSLPAVRRIMPLKDACGRYVDWYRVR